MTRRETLKRGLSAAVCASLLVLSPGLEFYAAAGSVARIQVTDAAAPLSGPVGQSQGSVLRSAPFSASLTPATLSGSIHAVPGSPVVSETSQVQAGVATPVLPQAPAVLDTAVSETPALPGLAVRGAVLSKAVNAAPEQGQTQTPIISAQAVLETGAQQIDKAQDSSGRKVVLDAVFTGEKAKPADDAAIPAATSLPKSAGVLLAPAEALSKVSAEVPAPQAALPEVLAKAKVYLTRAGQAPVAATLATLGETLAADPSLKEAFNKMGRVRVVLSKLNPRGGLTQADVAKVQQTLSGYGITAKLEVENVPIDWSKGREPAASAQTPGRPAPPQNPVLRILTAPFRELAYLGRTFIASYTNPSLRELVAGVVLKLVIPLAVLNGAGWISMYDGHAVAKALALGLTLGLNVFHGIWVKTWANLQNNIGKQRGMNYQSGFNLLYGQLWGVLYRLIAYSAIPNTVPPWSYKYWKDMGISTIIGTFMGTLAFQGVNGLYNNGRLNQWQRSAIFLVRDLIMCLAGTFFGSGSMAIFWTVFAAQQILDLALYAISRSRWGGRRPIIYVADEMVAATPEFQSMYPVTPTAGEPESPLRQAWKGLLESPFVKPVVWLVKKLRDVLAKKK